MIGFKHLKTKPRLKNQNKSSEYKTKKSSRSINDLPDEILAEIFAYLTVVDLALNVKYVCHRWNDVLSAPRIWYGKTFAPPRKSRNQFIVKVLKNASMLENFSLPKPICFSKPIVQTLVNHCTNIKRLNLYVYHNEYEEVHQLLDCLSGTLIYLVLDIKVNCLITEGNDIIDKFLTAIATCPKLNGLSLNGAIVLKATHLFMLASSLPFLLHLNLSGIFILDSCGWESFLEIKGKNLLSLSFAWIYAIGDTIFSAPAKYCPVLEKLCITPTITSIDTEQYKVVLFEPLKTMVKLKDLSITALDIRYWNDMLDVLESGSLVNLERLDLSSIQCDGNRLMQSIFNECCRLKYLTLQDCGTLTDASLQSIYLLNHLLHLDLSGCRALGNKAVVHVVQCTTLEYLYMNDCPRITASSLTLCFDKLRSLKELHMNLCSFRPQRPIPNQLRNTLRVREPRTVMSVRRTYKALRSWRDSRNAS